MSCRPRTPPLARGETNRTEHPSYRRPSRMPRSCNSVVIRSRVQ
jgi:hypothetical protein